MEAESHRGIYIGCCDCAHVVLCQETRGENYGLGSLEKLVVCAVSFELYFILTITVPVN